MGDCDQLCQRSECEGGDLRSESPGGFQVLRIGPRFQTPGGGLSRCFQFIPRLAGEGAARRIRGSRGLEAGPDQESAPSPPPRRPHGPRGQSVPALQPARSQVPGPSALRAWVPAGAFPGGLGLGHHPLRSPPRQKAPVAPAWGQRAKASGSLPTPPALCWPAPWRRGRQPHLPRSLFSCPPPPVSPPRSVVASPLDGGDPRFAPRNPPFQRSGGSWFWRLIAAAAASRPAPARSQSSESASSRCQAQHALRLCRDPTPAPMTLLHGQSLCAGAPAVGFPTCCFLQCLSASHKGVKGGCFAQRHTAGECQSLGPQTWSVRLFLTCAYSPHRVGAL